MKASEFYLKYVKIKQYDGKMISPSMDREMDSYLLKCLDISEELNIPLMTYSFGSRLHWGGMRINPEITKLLK
jgi:hypothetical protein